MAQDCSVCGLPTVGSAAPLVTYAEAICVPPSISQPLRDLVLCGACDETKRLLRSRSVPAAMNWRRLSEKVKDESVQAFMDFLLEEHQFQLAEYDGKRAAEAQRKLAITKVLATPGLTFEGFAIKEYRYFVSEEAVVGLVRLPSAGGIRFPDAESQTLKKKLAQARLDVLESLAGTAVDLGANAIIGLNIDYKTLGESILAVVGSGTTVVIEPVDCPAAAQPARLLEAVV